ncbi:MAG: YdeI/OmpD-associated family protein, partial [Myxococcales bacterium]|nr:YdeI/OmpD-associated family protein [Myxococcales bacterium]
ALCFGWIDGLAKGVDAERYRQRFSPRRPGSRWSSSNKKRIAKLEVEGRLAPAGRRVVERARADGSWDELPDAERAFEDPPALLALLARNPEVAAIYAGFSPAHRRQYVLWIASAKKAETQERRAAKAEAMILARERPM